MGKQAKQVKSELVANVEMAKAVELAKPETKAPAAFSVYGSKRPLTGMPKNFGTATENLSKNANALRVLTEAAKAKGGELTQADAVAALATINHKASFFGYAKRRGWLGETKVTA